jgi:uncharacterized Zn-binding protein involved in type VI secretion
MPGAARKGDAGLVHCSGYTIAEGSPDVRVNGRPVARKGDQSTTHLLPGSPCPSHTAPIEGSSSTVFANGRGVARVGDGLTGCTAIAEGSGDVIIG